MAVEVGQKLEGKVVKIAAFGAFVQLETGETGLVHISEVANTYVTDINEHLKVGDKVTVKVVSTGEGGRIILMEAEPLSVTVDKSAARKSGERVSGDRCVYFRTDEGILYVILSDGMGSGPDAAGMSAEAVEITERFLKAGVGPDLTVSILSSLCLLRDGDGLESATVDLLRLDMFSGEAAIYKYGAAPHGGPDLAVGQVLAPEEPPDQKLGGKHHVDHLCAVWDPLSAWPDAKSRRTARLSLGRTPHSGRGRRCMAEKTYSFRSGYRRDSSATSSLISWRLVEPSAGQRFFTTGRPFRATAERTCPSVLYSRGRICVTPVRSR